MTQDDNSQSAIEAALHGGAHNPLDDKPRIDLNHATAAYQHGPIMVWMTWLRTLDRWEPCIAITRARIMGLEGNPTIPCVVPLSRAYAWTGALSDFAVQNAQHPQIMADLRDVMTTAAEFAFTLGLDGMNQRDVFRVLTVVNDHLSELISMPPRPQRLGETHVADLVVEDRLSGKVWESEVHDVV